MSSTFAVDASSDFPLMLGIDSKSPCMRYACERQRVYVRLYNTNLHSRSHNMGLQYCHLPQQATKTKQRSCTGGAAINAAYRLE